MGVSLETYRMRIGSFGPSSKVSNLNSHSTRRSSTNLPKSSWKMILSLTIIFGILLALFAVAIQADLQCKIKPKTCPASTASPAPYSSSSTSPSTGEFSSLNFSYFARSPQIIDVNFNSRYVNGNKRRNGIKILDLDTW